MKRSNTRRAITEVNSLITKDLLWSPRWCELVLFIRYIAFGTTRKGCSLLEMLNKVDKAYILHCVDNRLSLSF